MKAEADPDKTENYCQIVPQFPAYNSYCKNMTILSLFPPPSFLLPHPAASNLFRTRF